jgi:hypothetical protein
MISLLFIIQMINFKGLDLGHALGRLVIGWPSDHALAEF